MKSKILKNKKLQKYIAMYKTDKSLYHTIYHIDTICNLIEHDNTYTVYERNMLLCIALFHDIIYIPALKDNEVKSADYFITEFENIKDIFNLNEDDKKRIYDTILFTKYENKPNNWLEDAFLTLDMYVFYMSDEEKEIFEKQIRNEYIFVTADIYYHYRKLLLLRLNDMYEIDITFNLEYLKKQEENERKSN